MRPVQLKQLIKSRFNASIKRPLHVESPPGLGKTQIAKQAAVELSQELGENIACMAVHVPLMQPEDYGFPVVSAAKDDVSFIVSKDKFPIVGSKCPDKGILLLDELSQGDNPGQKILAQLIQEREIHGQHLKPNWLIISTGNKITDRAGANRILSHLRNRITTVPLEVSMDDWTNWALANGIKSEVIGFLRFRPELLNAFKAENDINPTPRSWSEGVSAALGIVPSELEHAVFSGDVGEGAAAEFCGFLKIFRKLPSPDVILMNPETAELPKDPSVLYALVMALANRTTGDNFDRVMKYTGRMQPEFTALYVKDAVRRKPELNGSPIFTKWAAGPGAHLLK